MVTNRVNGRRDINFIEHLARIRRVLPCQPSTIWKAGKNNCTWTATLECDSFRLGRRVRNTAREQHGPASAASIWRLSWREIQFDFGWLGLLRSTGQPFAPVSTFFKLEELKFTELGKTRAKGTRPLEWNSFPEMIRPHLFLNALSCAERIRSFWWCWAQIPSRRRIARVITSYVQSQVVSPCQSWARNQAAIWDS